jgi:hypothetical protein
VTVLPAAALEPESLFEAKLEVVAALPDLEADRAQLLQPTPGAAHARAEVLGEARAKALPVTSNRDIGRAQNDTFR